MRRGKSCCRFFVFVLLMQLILSGCSRSSGKGENEIKELPTLRVMTLGTNHPAALERVSEAVSVLTRERIGCNIRIETMDSLAYGEMIKNLRFEEDLADIFICTDRTVLNTLVDGHFILRLDRPLDKQPGLKDIIDDQADWSMQQVDGHTYAIPFGNDNIWAWGFLMKAEICDELEIIPQSVTGIEELHQVLQKVHRYHPGMPVIAADHGEVLTFASYDVLGGGVGSLLYNSEETELTNIVETQPFLQQCAEMRTWYEEGLFIKNISMDTLSRLDWLGSGGAFGSFCRIGKFTTADAVYTTGKELYSVPLGPHYKDNALGDHGFCIAASTPDRKLCIQFMDLLYQDVELRRLCALGMEGIDYQLDDEGLIHPVAMETGDQHYVALDWPLREQTFCLANQGKEEWPSGEVQVSQGYGFIFDDTLVKNEIYQCNVVMAKYFDALTSGMLDTREGSDLCINELKAAGMEAVLQEKKRQWEIWEKSVYRH